MEDEQAEFRFLRTVNIRTFYIGSAAADLLVTSVWNRIKIVDLGMAAWPVALLSALRYFLAPLGLWAGHRADTHPDLGQSPTGLHLDRACPGARIAALAPAVDGANCPGVEIRLAPCTPGLCNVRQRHSHVGSSIPCARS